MPEAESTDGRDHVRDRILHNHMERVIRIHRDDSEKLLTGLTYQSAIDLADEVPDFRVSTPSAIDTDAELAQGLPGGLDEDDLSRFAFASPKLSSSSREHLVMELQKTLTDILDLWNPTEADDEKIERALDLPNVIRTRKQEISSLGDDLRRHHIRVSTLISEINEIHPRLEGELMHALETLPPLLETERSARYDVLAVTIETCLLKLSLMRSRMHSTLYGYKSTKNPEATMSKALNAVHKRLKQKQKEQNNEERELDRQINEYQSLLHLVDGRDGGGFAQVVEDMARVRKDTEECRRDLRRLGWTGD
ncbi:unnamed protein product [Somion occarium]|uniref:Uncharacterized protein n=1 Tax=Somion occarium TaxID=3059160 RepID=A0ABP1E682_9APHY